MPSTRRRTATKLLRFYPEELAHISSRAEACGLKPARFIREAALGPMPKARQHVDTDRLLRALARIGGSLEQLARLTHTGRGAALTTHVAAALTEQHALVKQVMQNGRRSPHRSPR